MYVCFQESYVTYPPFTIRREYQSVVAKGHVRQRRNKNSIRRSKTGQSRRHIEVEL